MPTPPSPLRPGPTARTRTPCPQYAHGNPYRFQDRVLCPQRRSSGKVARWTAEEEIRLKVPPHLPRSRSRQHRLHLGGSSYKRIPGSILHPDLIRSLLLSPPLWLPPRFNRPSSPYVEPGRQELIAETPDASWGDIAERLGTGRSGAGIDQHYQILMGKRKSYYVSASDRRNAADAANAGAGYETHTMSGLPP